MIEEEKDEKASKNRTISFYSEQKVGSGIGGKQYKEPQAMYKAYILKSSRKIVLLQVQLARAMIEKELIELMKKSQKCDIDLKDNVEFDLRNENIKPK